MSKSPKSKRYLVRAVAFVLAFSLGGVNLALAAGTPSASIFSLSTGPKTQTTSDRVHKLVSFTFTLVNGESREILIRQVGQNAPGLQLLIPIGTGTKQKLIPPSGPGKTRAIPAHKSILLTVWYHVSDCAKVPKGPWPLTVDLAWSSGKWQRAALQMPSASVPWPRSVTGFVCS